MKLLFHPATDLVLTLLLTLPLARASRNLVLTHPPGSLVPRLVMDSIFRGLVSVAMAFGILVLTRTTGINYVLVQISSLMDTLPARLDHGPGLLFDSGVEELSRLVCLSVFPLAMKPWHDQGVGRARLVGALGAGLVFGMVETLLLAARGLPLYQVRSPGSILLHVLAAGLIARFILEGLPLRGFLLAWAIHASYNWFLVLGDWWSLLSLPLLGLLMWLVMAENHPFLIKKAAKPA